MVQTVKFKVTLEEKGTRLDLFLSERLKVSRSKVKKMVDQGQILVNGKMPRKAGDILREGDIITTQASEHPSTVVSSNGEDILKDIDIVEENEDYIVVDKPAGLLVHQTEAQETNTLVAWLIEKYPEIRDVGDSKQRPGIVHRLDREASGLLVIARTQKMYEHLKKQFQARNVEKEYIVLVYGNIESDHNMINFEIDRGKSGRMVSRPKVDKLKLRNITKIQNGKDALTEFWVEKRLKRFTLLRVKIHSGRTHQIRVHMFAFGTPVMGDTLYFNKKLIKKNDLELNRLFLHAQKLCFDDLADKRVCFVCKWPKELTDYLSVLK